MEVVVNKIEDRLINLPLADLSIYANKIEFHINEIQAMLQRHALLKSKVKYYDKKGEKEKELLLKIEESQNVYNAIHIEIEARAKRDLGYDFEYEKFTNIQVKINNLYQVEIAKAKNETKNAVSK